MVSFTIMKEVIPMPKAKYFKSEKDIYRMLETKGEARIDMIYGNSWIQCLDGIPADAVKITELENVKTNTRFDPRYVVKDGRVVPSEQVNSE